jgi:Mg2+ and Co2+ transporter CorA
MSENNSPKDILFALAFNGQGGGEHVLNDKVSDSVKSTTLTWVHMDANNPDTRQWLTKEANYLDDLILDALLDSETRPRILENSKKGF